jgi:hypothetical protein
MHPLTSPSHYEFWLKLHSAQTPPIKQKFALCLVNIYSLVR